MSAALQPDIDWNTLDGALQSRCYTEAVTTLSPALDYYAGYDFVDGHVRRRTMPSRLVHQLDNALRQHDRHKLVNADRLLELTPDTQHLGLLSFLRHMSQPMAKKDGDSCISMFNQGEIDDINEASVMTAVSCLHQIETGDDNLQPVPVLHDQALGNISQDKTALVLFELGNIYTLGRGILEHQLRGAGRWIVRRMIAHDVSGTIQLAASFMDPKSGLLSHNPLRTTICQEMLAAHKTMADAALQVSDLYWENLGAMVKTMEHHPLLKAHYSWASWQHRHHLG